MIINLRKSSINHFKPTNKMSVGFSVVYGICLFFLGVFLSLGL